MNHRSGLMALVLVLLYAYTVVIPEVTGFCESLPELSQAVQWMDLINWFQRYQYANSNNSN